MKKFAVSVDFTYQRDFYINAETEEEAKKKALKLSKEYIYSGSNSGFYVGCSIADSYEDSSLADEDCD